MVKYASDAIAPSLISRPSYVISGTRTGRTDFREYDPFIRQW